MRKNVLLEQAHAILSSLITKDDVIIDATMGNGHDTLFLASLAKEVYAFDIQKEALLHTQEKVKDLKHVHLIHDSHENILDYVKSFKGVIFNLGYLPQGDLSITTMHETTIKTLNLLLPQLPKSGFIQIVCYPGHREGMNEHLTIQDWLKTLNVHHYQIIQSHFQNEEKKPPYLIMIYKTKDESC